MKMLNSTEGPLRAFECHVKSYWVEIVLPLLERQSPDENFSLSEWAYFSEKDKVLYFYFSQEQRRSERTLEVPRDRILDR